MRVAAIDIAPVKSLAVQSVDRVDVGPRGIAEDRRFVIADANGTMLTQRECGPLAMVAAHYDATAGRLELRFPDGRSVAGAVDCAAPATTNFYNYYESPGREVAGPFAEALSDYAGQPLRLVRTDGPGAAFDVDAITVASIASLAAFERAADAGPVDRRRFRQNFYIEGPDAHGEDAWVGSEIAVGSAVLRVEQRDSRCVMTQVNPDTGAQDLQTLKIIAAYRTDRPKQVEFGVYCSVAEPGPVAVGDEVRVVPTP